MAEHTGSCLCGKVKYSVTGEPVIKCVCHCLNCQKQSGAAFAANLMFRRDDFRILQGQESLKVYEDSATSTGNTVKRNFCGNCGSNLFSINDDEIKIKNLVIVTSGSLDHASLTHVQPTTEFFGDSKRDWLNLQIPKE